MAHDASESDREFGRVFDVDWVAAAARRADPGLSEETSVVLSQEAWMVIRALGELDAPAVARALMADGDCVNASSASVVARAAVDFCMDYEVELT